MKKIDSQALEVLKEALGLSGAASPVTELTDGIVDQVLWVNDIIRRSRTQAQTGGLYTGILKNTHAAADSRVSALLPYNATIAAIPPYPTPMPRGFDVWILSAAVTQASGTGTLQAALLLECPASVMGLSSTTGAFQSNQNLAFWDTVIVENTTFGIASGITEPTRKIGLRIPRAPTTALRFASTSSAAAVFDCFITLGVFPTALGQDVLV